MSRIKRPQVEDTLVTLKDLHAFRVRYVATLEARVATLEAEAQESAWRRLLRRLRGAR